MSIQIGYDSKTINLLLGPDSLLTNYKQERKQARSGSGKIETISLHGIQEMSFEAHFTEAIYRDLVAWWSWARQGKSWSFAKDSGNVGNTTLDDTAAADQKNVPLTATTAFSANDICLIRAVDNDDEYEIVVIGSVDTGVKIVAVDDLKWSYTATDIFRHYDYWPDVVSLDTNFNPKRTGDYYKHVFKFVENL